MTALIQSLMEKFSAVVFEKDAMGYRDTSQLQALLPLLVNSNSNVENKFNDLQERMVHLNCENND